MQSWAQSYQYDGFGNLTAKTLQTGAGAAVTTAIPVTVSTNRLANASYDGNGNMTSGSGVTLGYDEANRIASVTPTSGGAEYYGYAPDNKRVYRLNPATGVEELTLYGASGEKLAKFLVNRNTMSPVGAFVWFGGKMVGPGMGQQDRLGTNRGGGRFYPYGEQIGSATGTDGVQFATYRRDGVSGLDYADQRYYASTLGRFNTVDPYRGSASSGDPGSWNRFSYTRGDPANRNDPHGLVGTGGCGSENGPAECALDDGTAYAWEGASANSVTGGVTDPCIQIIFGFSAPPGSVACTWATIAVISPDKNHPEITCEEEEIAFVSTYLAKYNSPLASSAARIVLDSDALGLDDRFIVALSGVESTYGKTQNPLGSGQYNAFSNGAHCAGLGVNAYCKVVNPYSSFEQAIDDVTQLIGSGRFYKGYNSTRDIYSIYETGSIKKTSGAQGILDQIYGKQLGGDVSNVRKTRCP